MMEKSKKLEQMSKQLENKKDKIEKDHLKTNVKFQISKGEKAEEEFKSYTVGLSTKEEFKRKQDNIQSLIQDRLDSDLQTAELFKKNSILKRKQQYKSQKKNLSFMDDDEEEEEEEEDNNENENEKDISKKDLIKQEKKQQQEKEESEIQNEINNPGEIKIKKVLIGKNPNANTQFLPDSQRDRIQFLQKEKLKQEYEERKIKLENQFIEVQYSYWDGFKIVKKLRVKQKTSVYEFIDQCRKSFIVEYPVLAKTKTMDLLAVARDHILQQKLTFYEIIEGNMTNRKGQQLFDFTNERTEKDSIGNNIIIGEDAKTVIMIIEKKVTERQGDNPLYYFLKENNLNQQ